jgi:hypothetical protein
MRIMLGRSRIACFRGVGDVDNIPQGERRDVSQALPVILSGTVALQANGYTYLIRGFDKGSVWGCIRMFHSASFCTLFGIIRQNVLSGFFVNKNL